MAQEEAAFELRDDVESPGREKGRGATLRRMIIRRLALLVPVGFSLVLLLFLLIRLAPGDPATSALGTFSTQEMRDQFILDHDLDAPLYERFTQFLGDVLRGELGRSVVKSERVSTLIAISLPVTAQLAGLAALLAVILAGLLGSLAALRAGGPIDSMVSALTTAGTSAPDFWVALLAIQVFAVGLGVLPPGGFVPFEDGPLEWARSLAMPVVVLSIPFAAALARVLRASLVDELNQDYVRTLRGQGAGGYVIITNVLRNASLSPLTVLGLRLGYLMSGTIIVESVFGIPGMGRLLTDAVNQGDISVVQGVALVGAAIFMFLNLVVDILYFTINPRLGAERA